jgi:hypothetical protein
MTTKNEFFANYFKEMLKDISNQLDVFSKKGLEQFGNENEPLANNIMDTIAALEEMFSECVINNRNEGYPVIDIYLEETEGPSKNEKIHEAIKNWNNCNNELKDLMRIPLKKLTPELREKIQAKHKETMQAWKIYSELNN